MQEAETININETTINKYVELFKLKSSPNQFYNKNVFFSQKLLGLKYKQFQVIGNLGGHPTDSKFTTDVDYYIISNTIVEELKQGIMDSQLVDLENKLNLKGKKYDNLTILTEKVFIEHIYQRCLSINDQVTLNLIKHLI